MYVLVVEDNEEVADSLAFLLDCYGHRVTVVEDGERALSLLRRRGFHLVLLDENLPGIKGSEVARSIVNTPSAVRPFLVSMTGDSEDSGIARLFDLCLRKPFTLDALLQALEDARVCGKASALLAA